MKTRPLAHTPFGVEIVDFELTSPLSPRAKAELNEAFDKHRLLLFRGGDVGPEIHVSLVDAISPVTHEGQTSEYYSFNSTIREDAYIPGRSGSPFHADYMFTPHGPIQVVSLAAVKMEANAPTTFCDSVTAFKALPPELQQRLRQLNAVHCQAFNTDYGDPEQAKPKPSDRARVSNFAHLPRDQISIGCYPAVLRHPRTGEEVLMHSPGRTSHFEGMTEEESDVLFAEIIPHQYKPEHIYVHDWREGDLLIWDNIALQHGRHEIGAVGERLLRRVAGNPTPVHEVMKDVRPVSKALRTPAEPVAS